MMKRVLAVMGIFIIGIGMGIGTMVLKEKLLPATEAKASMKEAKIDEIGPLLEIGEFIINLKGGGILKAEITVEGINAKSLDRLKAREAFLRDRVINVFAAKELKDIVVVGERDNLKKEILTELNLVTNDEVKSILFKSFVYSL